MTGCGPHVQQVEVRSPDGFEVCGDDRCCEQVSTQPGPPYSTLDLAIDATDRARIVTQPYDNQAIIYLVESSQDGFTTAAASACRASPP